MRVNSPLDTTFRQIGLRIGGYSAIETGDPSDYFSAEVDIIRVLQCFRFSTCNLSRCFDRRAANVLYCCHLKHEFTVIYYVLGMSNSTLYSGKALGSSGEALGRGHGCKRHPDRGIVP